MRTGEQYLARDKVLGRSEDTRDYKSSIECGVIVEHELDRLMYIVHITRPSAMLSVHVIDHDS